MATQAEESRKLLCACGKHARHVHHGGARDRSADGCKETTIVPYRISDSRAGQGIRAAAAGEGARPERLKEWTRAV